MNTLNRSSVTRILVVLFVYAVLATGAVAGISLGAGSGEQSLLAQRQGGLTFIENQGQWDTEVRFLVRMGGMDAWLTSSGLVFDFYEMIEADVDIWEQSGRAHVEGFFDDFMGTEYRGHVVRMQFEGTGETRVTGHYQREGYHNYFIGNDPERWTSNVPLYGEVLVADLYEGIGMRLYDDAGFLRYDLLTEPGADISQVRLSLIGADAVWVTSEGDLAMETSLGEVRQTGLLAYQEVDGLRVEVPVRFRLLEANVVGFEAELIDSGLPLVIDPLIYSTFLGGSNMDLGHGIAADASGSAYITGIVRSNNFPITEGAYQTSHSGGPTSSAFITRFSPDGTLLLFSTFLGGSSADEGSGIAINDSGDVFVFGKTISDDFPVTEGAYNPERPQNNIVSFIARLSPDGSSLVYSTYFIVLHISSIVAINDGSVFITGGVGFPFEATEGAYQPLSHGVGSSGVIRFSPDGSSLMYATYLGGTAEDRAYSIAVSISGSVFVTGYTRSSDFPTTPGAYREIFPDDAHQLVFVTCFNPDLSALVYSTFLGEGTVSNLNYGITVDGSGSAFVTGQTWDHDFPTTEGAYQTSYPTAYWGSGYVTRLSSDGSDLIYSTFLGGGQEDLPRGIVIDESGSAFIVGTTKSPDFPTTDDAFQSSYPGGERSAFISRLSVDGTRLVYSTFLGGTNHEIAYGIALDSSGSVLVTGATNSADFPVTEGAYMTSIPYWAGATYVTRLQPPAVNIDDPALLPQTFLLGDTYPNPFTTSARINFELPHATPVRLEVYDLLGRRVRVVLDEDLREAGRHEVEWSASGLSQGVYFIRMTSGTFSQSRRVTIIR